MRALSPTALVPFHGVRDRTKLAALKVSLAAEGWRSRPLLAVQQGCDTYAMLLTGSHRWAAVDALGLPEIPVYVLDAEACGWLIDGENVYDERGERLWRGDEILAAVRRTGDEDAIALMVAEMGGL